MQHYCPMPVAMYGFYNRLPPECVKLALMHEARCCVYSVVSWYRSLNALSRPEVYYSFCHVVRSLCADDTSHNTIEDMRPDDGHNSWLTGNCLATPTRLNIFVFCSCEWLFFSSVDPSVASDMQNLSCQLELTTKFHLCIPCNSLLTVEHMVISCIDFDIIRQNFYTTNHNIHATCVLKMLLNPNHPSIYEITDGCLSQTMWLWS